MSPRRYKPNPVNVSGILLSALLVTSTAFAQQDATIQEVIEVDAAEIELEQSADIAENDMSTPLRSLVNLGRAGDAGDLEAAAEYMDMRYLPEGMSVEQGPELIRQLRFVWVRNNIVDPGTISDEPEGHLDDGLPSYRDLLGTIETEDGGVDVLLQRVPGPGGTQVWKISNATVAMIPDLWDEFGYGPYTQALSDFLPEMPLPLDLENWQLIYLLATLVLSWPLALLIAWVLRRIAIQFSTKYRESWLKLFGWPTKVFAYIYLVRYIADEISLPLRARIFLDHGVAQYVAWACLLIGLLDFYMAYELERLRRANRVQQIALLRPVGLIVKYLIVIILALLWAENAGYNTTTIIAGLGVGSVAVALAAKNTIENLIGAITIYIARPISVGDFCRFGSTVGTVEEIGIRATHLRTLDRTLVYIPNAIFASDEVENYSKRDRIRYYRELRIRLDSTPDQVRFILVELRRLFLEHPKVQDDTISIRFDRVTEDAINLRIDGGTMTRDFQEYLAIAEDLNLHVLDTLKASGTWFAMPTRSIRTEEADATDAARKEEVEKVVAGWGKEDRLMFPDYSD